MMRFSPCWRGEMAESKKKNPFNDKDEMRFIWIPAWFLVGDWWGVSRAGKNDERGDVNDICLVALLTLFTLSSPPKEKNFICDSPGSPTRWLFAEQMTCNIFHSHLINSLNSSERWLRFTWLRPNDFVFFDVFSPFSEHFFFHYRLHIHFELIWVENYKSLRALPLCKSVAM